MFSVHGTLVLFGVVVHLVLLYSIFDIYYTSPLVRGTHPHPITNSNGLANRIVIFSADGLRSDTFFQHPEKSPFLHDIIRNRKGCWGVSVSHVPTESRPGHVALLAGFYEDVSAVARGWKLNPVPFDSIINRSRSAWAWGSPDIVPMFTEGISHAVSNAYSSDLEDFLSTDAAQLDRWVFNKVEELLETADPAEKERLHSDRAVFFLHLLGLDTNGHGYKPYSKQYIDNIGVVDEGVSKTVHLFENFFSDNRTAFLFTSDHGMTDWGSHGAGTDAEVLTPFVVWGSGIQPSSLKKEISQVDLAPLMAAVLGTPVPMNSVGILPLTFLNAQPRYQFQSSYANLKQMLEQFVRKREEKRSHSFPLMFREFHDLKPKVLSNIENEIRRLTEMRRFDAAAITCLQWIPRIRAGLLYFHRYDRFLLGCSVACIFLSWTVLIYLYASRPVGSVMLDSSIFIPSRLVCYILGSTYAVLLMHYFPFPSCVYILLPIYISSVAYNIHGSPKHNSLKVRIAFWMELATCTPKVEIALATVKLLITGGIAVLLLTIFVTVFAHRLLLSLTLLLLAFYPTIYQENYEPMKLWCRLWSLCCVLLAIFPVLPPVGRSPFPFLCVASPLAFSIFLFVLQRRPSFVAYAWFYRLGCAAHAATAFIIAYVNYCGSGGDVRMALIVVRLFAWMSIPAALVLPLMAPQSAAGRLIGWFFSLHIPYSLLSISYESLFLEVFFVLLLVFIRMEFVHVKDTQFWEMPLWRKKNEHANGDVIHSSPFSLLEWTKVLMLVVFIEVGFFGTGNVASLNSFNPSFLRCFLSVFSPFTMTTLLIYKIAIPFLSVTLAFAVVLLTQRDNIGRLSVMLLIITDSMALVFFFRLVDDGSWLEIGMSISHYVISMAISVIVFLLLHLAEFLLPLSIEDLTKRKKKYAV